MFKVLILGDDEHYNNLWRIILNKMTGITQIHGTSISQEAIVWALNNKPDLFICTADTRQNSRNGIDVVKEIHKFDSNIDIIFAGSYLKNFLNSEAFISSTNHYIGQIKSAQVKTPADNKYLSNSDILTLSYKNEVIYLDKRLIYFVEAFRHNVYVHTYDGIFEIHKSLNTLEAMLGEGFLRVHRSYIVNLGKIRRVITVADRSYEIEFTDYYNKKASMSRNYYPQYKQYFNN